VLPVRILIFAYALLIFGKNGPTKVSMNDKILNHTKFLCLCNKGPTQCNAFDTASCKRWQAQGIQFRPNNPTVFGFTEAVSDTACEIKPQLFKSQKSRISLVTRA